MGNLPERIAVELENIDKVLSQLSKGINSPRLSDLELAGVAALVHNFYNGIENILKQAVRLRKHKVPQGPNWHRDLLVLAVSSKIVSRKTCEALKPYLAFRHFFSHSYAFDLDQERIFPLVRDIQKIYAQFRRDLEKFKKN